MMSIDFTRRGLAFMVGVVCFIRAADADILTDMTDFYNGLGATGQATGDQLYRAQSAHLYTGGGAHVRTPIRRYNLVNVQLPYIRAGCGGIDASLGSFSYINFDNIKKLGDQIVTNGTGYALQLALSVLSPMIMDEVKNLRSTIEAINGMNINSCEASREIIKGALMATGAQSGVCEALAAGSGSATDTADARFLCQDQTYANKILGEGNAGTLSGGGKLSAADAQKVAKNLVGNLLWTAMKKDKFLQQDPQLSRLLMSLSGTVIQPPPPGDGTPPGEPRYYEGYLTFALLFSATSDKPVPIFTCLDDTGVIVDETENGCLNLGYEPVDVSAFRTHIKKSLDDLVTAVTNDIGQGGTLTAQETFILTRTELPLMRLIQVAADVDRSLVDTVLAPYTDAIVADVLHGYLRAAFTVVKTTLHQAQIGREEDRRKLSDDINRLLAEAATHRQAVLHSAGGMAALIEKITLYQRYLAASFSPTMNQRLAFAKMLERR